MNIPGLVAFGARRVFIFWLLDGISQVCPLLSSHPPSVLATSRPHLIVRSDAKHLPTRPRRRKFAEKAQK